MIMQYYDFVHSIGWHLYTIPTMIVLAVALIAGLVHWRNQKKRGQKHEELMAEAFDEYLENGCHLEDGFVNYEGRQDK